MFTKQNVEYAGVIRLDDKKEYLLEWYIEKSVSDNGVGRICPYASMNEERIPWSCPDDSYLSPVDPQFWTSMDRVRLTTESIKIFWISVRVKNGP